MAKAIINAGICGFTTIVTTELLEDGQNVSININTSCPNISKGIEDLKEVDAFGEIFTKLHETKVYKTLSPHIPHVTCPIYSGILKAIEVEAGLALPADATITLSRD